MAKGVPQRFRKRRACAVKGAVPYLSAAASPGGNIWKERALRWYFGFYQLLLGTGDGRTGRRMKTAMRRKLGVLGDEQARPHSKPLAL